jgi:hypothetical protein
MSRRTRPRATRTTRRRFAPVVVGVVLGAGVIATGTAYAYWGSTGTGSGTAGAAASSSNVVTGTATASGLTPVGAGATVNASAIYTNTGTASATVISVAQGGTITDNMTGCPGSSITFNTTTTSKAVAAGSTSSADVLANAVTMSSTAPSACQGATFTIPLTLTWH